MNAEQVWDDFRSELSRACPISADFDNRPWHGLGNLRRQGMVSSYRS